MAISTYTELKTKLARWLNRDDLTDDIVDFIQLCEAEMNRTLVENEMEVTATVTITSGLGDLPSDCRDILSVKMPDGLVLEPEDDREADKYRSSGEACAVTVSGTQLRIVPPGDATYDVTLRYRQKVPSLSDSNASNWVLESHPDAYLYGALSHAELFILNDDRVPMIKSLYAAAIGDIIRSNAFRMVNMPELQPSVAGGIG